MVLEIRGWGDSRLHRAEAPVLLAVAQRAAAKHLAVADHCRVLAPGLPAQRLVLLQEDVLAMDRQELLRAHLRERTRERTSERTRESAAGAQVRSNAS